MSLALKKKIDFKKIQEIKAFLHRNNLATVCEAARCPNKSECYGKKTATFLILGKVCTRNCRFCSVNKNGRLLPPDIGEPERIAEAVCQLNLSHVVITSVTRDDIPDAGAGQFVAVIEKIRQVKKDVIIEVLTPDFYLKTEAIDRLIAAGPEIFNHNLETVPRLYHEIRPEASYENSLKLLEYVKNKCPEIFTKSGIMMGLGETKDEVEQVLVDLKEVNCDTVIIGQYFQPTKQNVPVARYLSQQEFDEYREIAKKLGFLAIASGSYMRSSYLAKELYEKIKLQITPIKKADYTD